MVRILKWLGLGIVLVIVVGGIFGWVWLRSSLPETEGEITVTGLDAPVTLGRDDRGVAYIKAETRLDAMFALGFAHAQDRLWQLEMNRRIAAGRVSEFAGPSTVDLDRFMRTLSVRDRARRAWRHQTEETRNLLRAYADGINAWMDGHKGALPPEFLLTGVEPEPWTPIDSISWHKMMALDLSGNYWNELARLDLSDRLSREQLQQFFPPYPGDDPLPLPDFDALYDGLEFRSDDTGEAQRTAQLPLPGRQPFHASNNWVISGERTASGAPILANDPHLGLTSPSIWYLARIEVGDSVLVGATLAGLPQVVLGRNGDIAWGFTNTGPDVQDLYLEKVLNEGAQYLTPDGPRDFITRDETIRVKDGEDVAFTVRETRHGPVISDAREDVASRLPENTVLALQWTALAPEDTTISAGAGYNHVSGFENFVESLQLFNVPQQNIVYADRDGNIGYYAPALVPVRGPRNDTHGMVPAPGWKAAYDWQGFIPRDELPRRLNPESGMIVTANEKVVDDDYPHFLSRRWAMPYRGDRIRALIDEAGSHTLDSMKRIQMDVRSTLADDLLPVMLDLAGDGHADILAALADWDREMRVDAPEPLIFAAWRRHLGQRVYADELGARFPDYWQSRPNFIGRVLRGEYAAWCDDIATDTAEACDAAVTGALDDAIAALSERFGDDWRSWRWGDAHPAVQEHRPMSNIPGLSGIFELRAEAPGGAYTVNVASPRFADGPDLYSFSHAPSYRAIYDMSDPDNSLYVIPTGQSGNPLSRHYKDQFDQWLAGEHFRIPPMDMADDLSLLALKPVRMPDEDGE